MKKFMLTYWVETHYLSARYYFGSADEDGDEGLMNELAMRRLLQKLRDRERGNCRVHPIAFSWIENDKNKPTEADDALQY
jgi:hypothetical protein